MVTQCFDGSLSVFARNCSCFKRLAAALDFDLRPLWAIGQPSLPTAQLFLTMAFSHSKIITMNKISLHGARNYPGEKPGRILAEWFNLKDKPSALCGIRVHLLVLDRHSGHLGRKWLRNPGAWLGQYFPQFRKQIKSGDWSLGSPYLSALNQFFNLRLDFRNIPKCSRCGKRFFARLKRQRFCSQRCQELHWKSSPRGKKYHREKSREYRELKKKHPNVG